MDPTRHPPGNPRLRRRKLLHGAVLPQRDPPRPRPRGHLRKQEAQRAPLRRPKKGPVQARRLLQGHPLPAAADLVHAPRSRHRLERDIARQRARSALGRGAVALLRHRRRADGRRRRGRGAGEPVRQGPARQELRPALPDRRRARLPLPALPAGAKGRPGRVVCGRRGEGGEAAGRVAPVPALVRAEVQE